MRGREGGREREREKEKERKKGRVGGSERAQCEGELFFAKKNEGVTTKKGKNSITYFSWHGKRNLENELLHLEENTFANSKIEMNEMRNVSRNFSINQGRNSQKIFYKNS